MDDSQLLSNQSPKHNFVSHIVGRGHGCDYTIGCNAVVIRLPEDLQSLDEALEYVKTQEKEGCLPYYGLSQVEKVLIYDICGIGCISAEEIRIQQSTANKNREIAFEEANLQQAQNRLDALRKSK
ncbi:hypothetical protein M0R72_07665 [Candidatus Pacearchaeota archaeon]|nr:hypothetical protein [Candidatus Pacearchaeota archaeon]